MPLILWFSNLFARPTVTSGHLSRRHCHSSHVNYCDFLVYSWPENVSSTVAQSLLWGEQAGNRKKNTLSVFWVYWLPTSCKKSETTYKIILRKAVYWQMNKWMWQTDRRQQSFHKNSAQRGPIWKDEVREKS